MFELQPIKTEVSIEGFNSIYYFEFDKNFSHAPEQHNFWELVYVDYGQIITVSDGIGYTLSQGQVVFHEPGEIHSHVSDKKVPNNMLVISFTATGDAMRFFSKKTFTLDKNLRKLLSLFSDEAKKSLGKIPSDYEDKNPLDFTYAPFGSLQLLQCYFSEFLISLIRSGNSLGTKMLQSGMSREIAHNSIAELAADYMLENIYSPLTLKDICEHLYTGKSKLCLIFSNTYGMSPMEYYLTLKLNEAKRLLREDELSVSEISDMLCYSSIHNFSRAFKKNVGCSPLCYKKRTVFSS